MAQDPLTGEVWLTDKARDDLGDDGPPDELNRLVPGGDYGWPRCTADRQPDREFGGGGGCADTIPPAIAFPAHLAPTGMAFYEGDMFPEEMRDDLFIASAGSTMRSLPIGSKVMRVAFEGGRPTGEVVDAVRGWLRLDTRRWGRPVDVEPAADGAMLIADDAGGRVFRLFYDPIRPTATPPR
jgi:glucose/arabinose dehydrogenase